MDKPEKVLLVTGFEPFGGNTVNASWEVVRHLPEQIGNYRIRKLQVPTVFGKAAQIAIEAAHKINADAVLAVGEAAGRTAVTPELVAINLRYAGIPDNEGQQPMDEPVVLHGENALFSTLPVRAMVQTICREGLPAEVSYSAGTYVCNDLLYNLLEHFSGSEVTCGFIHVPLLEESAPGGAYLPLECSRKCLEAAISVIAER